MRLLIAEDERELARALKTIFEKHNYGVDVVYDGQEALDYALSGEYDGAVLDVMMPKMNGYKISRLLKYDAKYKDIPILMVTARSQDEDKLIGQETGVNEYITKPFELDDVINKVGEYLG